MKIFVYILGLSNGKYYTGMTNDFVRRMKEHDNGQSKSTQRYRPIAQIWQTVTADRKTARRLEVKIKNRGARLFLLDQRFRPNRMYKNLLSNGVK